MIAMQAHSRDDGALAYDEIAPRYDLVPAQNRINRLMRKASVSHLLEMFPPGSRVLEVGCGTGDEALVLADHGVEVVAIDASAEMVRVATEKAKQRGLEGRVDFRRAYARDLPSFADSLGGPFDGGYASFSLAYEPDLGPVARGLHPLLRGEACFLASVPSRLCLVEFVLAIGSGHPGMSGRRLSPWHGHKVGGHVVPIRTYTPHAFADAMAPHFELERVEALPAIVPPPYMNRVYSKFDGFAEAVERADAILRSRFPFRSFGDHFLAFLRRAQ